MTRSMDTPVLEVVTAARASARAARHASSRPCHAVAAHVYELLDGELAPRVAAAIRDHLDRCLPCRSAVEREEAFVDLVARAARIEPAPTALVARVHEELTRAQWALEQRCALGPGGAGAHGSPLAGR